MRVKVLAMMALCIATTSCADKPVPPFASAPFSVARRGNVLSIPFTVPPTADLSYSYMLAFKYKRPDVDDPLMSFWSRPQREHLFLRVRLVFVHPSGQEEEIPRAGHYCEDEIARVITARESNVVNVDMHSVRRDIAHMEVVHFNIPKHGNYRFFVETIDDMPIFEPIVSWLTVEREYNHFK
jgi:hypothetical protein